MTPISVTCRPDESTRSPSSACLWIAEATVDGRVYVARSRHGAPNGLGRQLVDAGLADPWHFACVGRCADADRVRTLR
jgi:hypothetical protein